MSDVMVLPCPFCGGPGKLTPYNGVYHREDWLVHCEQCDLALEGDATPDAAVARWNRRNGKLQQ